jgi:hypothetical protein
MAAAQEQKSKNGETRQEENITKTIRGRGHHAHGRRKMGQDIVLHHERRRA